jgi:hypothetical protein
MATVAAVVVVAVVGHAAAVVLVEADAAVQCISQD